MNVFCLDSAFVEGPIRVKKVFLPGRQGITTIVVDLDQTIASGVDSLSLEGNPVKEIEGAGKLNGVKDVYCDNCGLDVVPLWVKALSAVEEVSFDNDNDNNNNNIKELPPWLLEIKTLKTVCIGHNKGE